MRALAVKLVWSGRYRDHPITVTPTRGLGFEALGDSEPVAFAVSGETEVPRRELPAPIFSEVLRSLHRITGTLS